LRHNGDPDESTSGRAYREGVLGGDVVWSRRARRIDFAFSVLEKNHCRKAYLLDIERAVERLGRADKFFAAERL
jgi:hypothetical protein